MPKLNKVNVFLDWDTVRRLDPKSERTPKGIERVINILQRGVSNAIHRRDKKSIYRVYWRVYHGWHQGKSKTPDRMEFESYARGALGKSIRNVNFSSDFELSGNMACSSHRSPIYDTWRKNPATGNYSQKMVDTLLTCDLLQIARSSNYDLLIVVANDDDILPAVFAAEAWKAKMILLHTREHTNKYLNLSGIVEKMVIA